MRKKGSIFIIIWILLVLVTGCGNSELKDSVKGMKDRNEGHVKIVKNGSFERYPNIKISEAFDTFFGNPQWTYFKAKSGEDVVEFSGNCMYQDVEVRAKMQFILNQDNSFQAGALSLNDVPQVVFMRGGLIEKVYEEYALKKGNKSVSQERQANVSNSKPIPLQEKQSVDFSQYEQIQYDKLVVQEDRYKNRRILLQGYVEEIIDRGTIKDVLIVISRGNEVEPKRVAIIEVAENNNIVVPEIGVKIQACGIYKGNRKEYEQYAPQIAQLPSLKLEKVNLL